MNNVHDIRFYSKHCQSSECLKNRMGKFITQFGIKLKPLMTSSYDNADKD